MLSCVKKLCVRTRSALHSQTAYSQSVCYSLLFFIILTLSGLSSSHASKHAALVVDGNTGKVLYARNADKMRYPASLTKMMTVYMLFREIKKGTISFDTQLTMTKTGASRPPSKLGLKPGSKITVINAIRALVTKSANDVAAAVGDNLAGSEEKFAAEMTKVAREIGMKNTTFRNASGLPNSEQKTTARDMYVLSRRLFEDFPKHFRVFKTKYFAYRGKRYRNHNRLLFGFRGIEGIKTGYTRASGFNLAASYRYKNKHVFAVVMGGRTSKHRNAQMRRLLRRYIPKAIAMNTKQKKLYALKRRKTEQKLAQLKASKAEAAKVADVQKPVAAPVKKPEPVKVAHNSFKAPVIRVLKVKPVASKQAVKPAVKPVEPAIEASDKPIYESNRVERVVAKNTNPTHVVDPEAQKIDRKEDEIAGVINSVYTEDKPKPVVQAAAIKAAGPFHIQVGAFSDHDNAKDRLELASSKGGSVLKGHPAVTLAHETNDKKIVRARFAAFTKSQAKSACRLLKRRSISCIVLRAE